MLQVGLSKANGTGDSSSFPFNVNFLSFLAWGLSLGIDGDRALNFSDF